MIVPTLVSIAGEPDIKNKLLTGYKANGNTYKVHLDGYDQSAFLKGTTPKSARTDFYYSDDDGLLVGMRQGDYKYVFAEQRKEGTMGLWAEPFTKLRLQKIFNLYQDPYERADFTSNTYWDWMMNHVPTVYGMNVAVMKFAETFKAYPPRSIPPTFSPVTIMEEALEQIKLEKAMDAHSAAKKK
ncbi:hypothetical protein EV143_101194 [Flavobacterium chryseum]|uniref:hypothetical protein n=1 Tax=Flavobacterium sp. P3160 TaxID=2512113 RepID=UPI0010D4D71A|nr:hypothetical protein [Flavobacterium sp. P3160]TDO83754.1 hypothetical protein EV143_101194 [Flavobacterium sp. P3160]